MIEVANIEIRKSGLHRVGRRKYNGQRKDGAFVRATGRSKYVGRPAEYVIPNRTCTKFPGSKSGVPESGDHAEVTCCLCAGEREMLIQAYQQMKVDVNLNMICFQELEKDIITLVEAITIERKQRERLQRELQAIRRRYGEASSSGSRS